MQTDMIHVAAGWVYARVQGPGPGGGTCKPEGVNKSNILWAMDLPPCMIFYVSIEWLRVTIHT